jgi:hypothetical protein
MLQDLHVISRYGKNGSPFGRLMFLAESSFQCLARQFLVIQFPYVIQVPIIRRDDILTFTLRGRVSGCPVSGSTLVQVSVCTGYFSGSGSLSRYSDALRAGRPGIESCRSQWPGDEGLISVAACLQGFRVRIPPEAWMFVVSVVCLSGRGLCNGLITRPEESCRLCCVILCDLET